MPCVEAPAWGPSVTPQAPDAPDVAQSSDASTNPTSQREASLPAPRQVLDFWFGDLRGASESGGDPRAGNAPVADDKAGAGGVRTEWFAKNDAFDEQVRQRFLGLVQAAEAGGLSDWDADRASPADRLALVLVCDQFPRNLFRGQARAFALDSRARAVARRMVERGDDHALSPVQRWFVYLPFEHAESLADQRESLRLFGQLRDDPQAGQAWDWAVRHAQVIERFGRFPHRNAALGRETTPEEKHFLQTPGSRF